MPGSDVVMVFSGLGVLGAMLVSRTVLVWRDIRRRAVSDALESQRGRKSRAALPPRANP